METCYTKKRFAQQQTNKKQRYDSLYNQMEEGIFQRYEKNKPDYLVLIGSIAFTLRDRIQKE